MTSALRFFILSLSIIALTGCYLSRPSFKNRDREYLSARSVAPLSVPPGISSSSFRASYPVSSRQYPQVVEDVSLMPPGLTTDN